MVGVILASRRSSIRTSVLATDNSFHDKVGGKRLQHDLNASANYFLPEDLRLGGEDLLTEQHAWCMIRLDTTRSSFYDIMDPLDEGDLGNAICWRILVAATLYIRWSSSQSSRSPTSSIRGQLWPERLAFPSRPGGPTCS